MARKVFVSYKYGDTKVPDLNKMDVIEIFGQEHRYPRATRVRDYVDELQEIIGKENIYLGEKDGESLEDFADITIEDKLKDKLFQSSVTIVIISKGMKDSTLVEKDQWIPWEISYSLKTVPRKNQTSKMNAILGVVLPDETGTYDWYYRDNADCNSITHFTNQLFKILKLNMFNLKKKDTRECNGTIINTSNEPSFIKTVKWDNFNNTSYYTYIDKAIEIKDDQLANDSYEMKIKLD